MKLGGISEAGRAAKNLTHAGLLQFLPEGEAMTNLATVVQQLRKERDQAQRRIEQLNQALEALTGVGGLGVTGGRRGRVKLSATRRTMSAAARKRIAAAQSARWAKWKAAQKSK